MLLDMSFWRARFWTRLTIELSGAYDPVKLEILSEWMMSSSLIVV